MNQKKLFNFFLPFLFFAVLAGPLPLLADHSVNINTADVAALDTVPEIGPAIAQRIIDYRTTNGLFAKIEDVQNVSGIGSGVTYDKIKGHITVGSSESQVQTSTTSSTSIQTQTQAQSQNQAAGAGPPAITVLITVDGRVTAGGGSYFSAVAYGTENAPLPSTRFIWNFGDGTTAEGSRVFHVYSYPGRYAVSVTGSYNYSAGIDRVVVEAVGASVSLEAKGDGSLLIRNKSPKEINIGLWSLVDGGKSYVIPEGTFVLAGEGVRFASAVTGLSGSPSAMLLYPNSMPAAAATVSADSPLRGERVTAAVVQKSAAVPKKQGEVLGANTSAPAAAKNSAPSPLWLSLGALAVLLAGAGGAVHYLGLSAKRPETTPDADGFDIE